MTGCHNETFGISFSGECVCVGGRGNSEGCAESTLSTVLLHCACRLTRAFDADVASPRHDRPRKKDITSKLPKSFNVLFSWVFSLSPHCQIANISVCVEWVVLYSTMIVFSPT